MAAKTCCCPWRASSSRRAPGPIVARPSPPETRCLASGPGGCHPRGGMARTWQEAISRDELDGLLAMSDWRSWLSLAVNWALVGAAMAVVAVWPNPLSVLVALFVIGARQL